MRGSRYKYLAALTALLAAAFVTSAIAQEREATADIGGRIRITPLPPIKASSTVEDARPHFLDMSYTSFGQAMKTRTVSNEIGELQLTLSAMRTKKARSANLVDLPSNYRPMFGAAGELSVDLSASDELALFGQWTRMRFKPVQTLAGRRFLTSKEQAAGLRWTNSGRFETQLSAYRVGPSGRRSALERMIELSGGSPRRASGLSLSLVDHPSGSKDQLSYGIDLRRQRTVLADRFQAEMLINEAIGSVFVRMAF